MSANPRDFSFCVAVVHTLGGCVNHKYELRVSWMKMIYVGGNALLFHQTFNLVSLLTLWLLYVHLYTYNHDRVMLWIEDFFSIRTASDSRFISIQLI